MGYPGAIWIPSPNFRAGRREPISHVVLHTTEGGLDGALAHLTDPYAESRVSSHYVVAEDAIYQLVQDDDEAWHAAAANRYSIGVEVIGEASNPATWTPGIVDNVAKLSSWLSAEYGIPLLYREEASQPPLARGYVAHGALDPERRYDPGPWFPWPEVKEKALAILHGSPPSPAGPPGAIVAVLLIALGLAWVVK